MTRIQKYLLLRKVIVDSLDNPEIEMEDILGASKLKLTFKDYKPLKAIIQDDYANNHLNHIFGLTTEKAYLEEERVLTGCSCLLNKLGERCWTER